MNRLTKTPREIARQMSQECIARRLRQANRMVTRLYDDALRSHGLTINQLNIVATVVSQGQLQPGQLGRMLGMEKSTVSRTVERMVKKGWLEVGPGQDGRSQLIKATPAGRQMLIAVGPLWSDLQETVLASMADNRSADSGADGGLSLLNSLGMLTHAKQTSAAPEDDFYDDDLAADFYG
ncbi:MAG: MarR family winged helix-turn-helix transcriptional regulator [Cyanobacteria bacterium P01_A01_bin.114]